MIVKLPGAGPLFKSAGVGPLSPQLVNPRTEIQQRMTAQEIVLITFPRLMVIVFCYVRMVAFRSEKQL